MPQFRPEGAAGGADLERAFAAFADGNGLLPSGCTVVAAASGGIDSMVLLRLLDGLRQTRPFSLSVAHVNHRLRGAESDEDEAFVREAAAALGLPFHLHRCSPPGNPGERSGVQEWARGERYRFLASLASAAPGTRIATAHHRDDNAETVLFNFLRGSGVRGLAGIPVSRDGGTIIRPLLFASRAGIAAYAAAAGVRWREDSSNAGTMYARNALRHAIIPAIEEAVNPSLREAMDRTALLFGDLDVWLSGEIARALSDVSIPGGEGLRLDAAKLAALPLFLRESVLHAAAHRSGGESVGFVHVRLLLRLLEAQSGSSSLLPGGLHAARERDCLVLRKPPPGDGAFDLPITPGQEYDFGHFSFSSAHPATVAAGASRFEEYVDAAKLGSDLRLRSWREGDWFIPLGLGSRKKLSDFFVDRKIALAEKSRIPILVSGDEVVWVCGERLDERFRLTPSTERVLLLRYRPAP